MYIRNNSFVFGTDVVIFFLVSLLYVVYRSAAVPQTVK